MFQGRDLFAGELDLVFVDATPVYLFLRCPLRRERAVAKAVLARPGRYQQVADNLKVKEVKLGERRYVVCHNRIGCEARRRRLEGEGGGDRSP